MMIIWIDLDALVSQESGAKEASQYPCSAIHAPTKRTGEYIHLYPQLLHIESS
jgi:hypothetical protein